MPASTQPDVMDKLVSLCKRRGFIFQASEIYGGTGSVWDYGPLGVELKKNLKDAWWRSMVQLRTDVVGLDNTGAAAALGLSTVAVRVARHRGLARLRRSAIGDGR